MKHDTSRDYSNMELVLWWTVLVEIGHNETGTEQEVQVVAVGGIVRGRGPVVSVVTDIALYPIVAKLNRRGIGDGLKRFALGRGLALARNGYVIFGVFM